MLNLMALKDEIDALTVKRGIGGESGTSVADRVLSQLLRSEEHTSELQSQSNIVCRLLLEKKNAINKFGCARCSAWIQRSPLSSRVSRASRSSVIRREKARYLGSFVTRWRSRKNSATPAEP